jgi:hypothetical protein
VNISNLAPLAEKQLWKILRGHARGAMLTNILKLTPMTRRQGVESHSLTRADNSGHGILRGARIS